jgi:hypothetical protein
MPRLSPYGSLTVLGGSALSKPDDSADGIACAILSVGQEGAWMMVALTDQAAALLQEAQEAQALPNPLRIEIARDQLTVGASEPAPDDEVLYRGDTPVLRVSAEAAEALTGYTLATQETPQGVGLTLIPPEEGLEDRISPDGRQPS